MAEQKRVTTLPDGRSIEQLRVVDLKQELKKYGVSQIGSKSQLAERLKAQIYLEELKQAPVHDGFPNQDIVDDESVASNSFIQQYLKQQQEQLKQRHERDRVVEAPPEVEKGDDIPEGLANQVDELNQSLSRSQSEEADKEPDEARNGEGVVDEGAETAQEEHTTSSRSSRRSRRQSAKQEEEAEVEPETRSTRRRTSSRVKEQEEPEEMKAPPQEVEQIQTINEVGKRSESEAMQDEATKVVEPSAPEEEMDVAEPAPTGDAENEATTQKVEIEEAKESRAQVEETDDAQRDGSVPDSASSEQTEEREEQSKVTEDPVSTEPERVEQTRSAEKSSGEVAADDASEDKVTIQEQVAPEKEASSVEIGDASESKEEQLREIKQVSTQKRVKLNRSTNLSRGLGSKTADEETRPEKVQVSEPEVSEKGDVQTNLDEDKDTSSAQEVVEKSPRKRITPPDDEDDQGQPDTTSKRRKTESDGEDTDKGPEESSQPVTSSREDGATASEGKLVAMTMGTDEGKDDAASAETPETNETEDGEIKEEGEVKEEEEQMETEPGVESNKEKETEPSQKVEQRSRSRSFTNVSSAPVKTKRLSFSSKDKAKETTGEEDKPEGVVNAPQVKKRRWGSTKKTTADVAKKTNVNISTQLLKDIIPEIKVPASELELDLEPEEGEESMEVGEVGETKKDEEKAEPVEDEEATQGPPRRKFIRQTITAPGAQHEEESDIDYEEDEEDDMVTRKVQQRDEDEEEEEKKEKKEKGSGDEESDSSSEEEDDDKEGLEDDGEKEGEDGDKEERKKKKKKIETPKDEGKENKQPEVKAKKVIQIKRAVRTMIDEPIRNTERDPSPSKRELSNIIHVNNLTRPFTLPQLKELLGRYGTLSADGFWMNNIKSHCFVTYESSDEATACREALHGTTWPSSNPKKLRVDFSDINELNRHMGVVVKKEPVKAEPAKEPERNTAARRERILHQDRERDLEQERRTKERERERERARKEREWDRGKERSQSPPERRRRTRSQERKDRHEEVKKEEKEVDEPPAKLLDDLFRKTKATPCIYWLPLTEEQALEREKTKAKLAVQREARRMTQEDRLKDVRDKSREDRMRRDRERPRARERSLSRGRRSRSRSRGRRR